MGSKVPLETVFNQFCSDKVNKKMSQIEFKKFVKTYIDKAADHEVDSLFKHFVGPTMMSSVSGQISLQDFASAFGREVKDIL